MGDIFTTTLSNLSHFLPLESQTIRCRKNLLSQVYELPLRRVNVLQGHTGCVNALSWANDGEVLLSGGDDTTVRLWRMDQRQDDLEQEYPFVCSTKILTGHTSNIFAAQMLPFSSRLATTSRDKQVRVIDIEGLDSTSSSSRSKHGKAESASRQNRRVIKCHSGPVKRIVTESSSDLFLTVSEDGSVRQHDLRSPPHICSRSGGCPAPLVKLRHRLSSLSLSPLTPYQFVVAGDAPYGYLFDRRHIGRFLEAEWGMPVDSDNMTTCVRRLARRRKEDIEFDYITGSRMSESGNEVILSYTGDSIYLFSTRDDPAGSNLSSQILTPNVKCQTPDHIGVSDDVDMLDSDEYSNDLEDMDIMDDSQDEEAEADDEPQSGVPLLLPKMRYTGISNVRTVKDVNFLGPKNEFVVSGSDDGNFFVWRRSTGALHGIYEGDSTVVNVIEGHPHLPLVAVSGIDNTVKLFSPGAVPDRWSKMDNATAIMARNESLYVLDPPYRSLLRSYALLATANSTEDDVRRRCNFQ